MNIALHVERLVLDGFDLPPTGQRLLQAAFEAELARLLGARGLPPGWESGLVPDTPSLTGAAIELAPGADPARLGRQIALSVFSSMAS